MLQDRCMPPCRDCKKEWTFTVLEQALQIERNQEHDPSRCQECRDKRKARRERGEVQGRNGRRDQTFYQATCAGCGGPAKLPFKPRNDRPVYCQDCHRRNRMAG
ncbi:MAG: CxxC-x17-CxxC domain-containing protein [Candidatus Xenobium sp.]|jgi:CxxC-x17-CxxC domain-containing protein|nr:zinc-binding protein [Burkholderiales bacterium]